MKKLLTAFCMATAFSAPAQTLFTYGKETVSANDFLRAFQKNNQGPATEKVLKDYLNLYIASRLKIKEAKEAGYDTLPQLITDLANLRQQILPAYLNDKESMEKMTAEAFARSQKDLHIAHIFIKAGDGAEQKKVQVQQALNKKEFAAIAKEFSDDPSSKATGGDLGWITAFSLPYELENLAYSTPVGKTSAPYLSKAGYHIFRNLGERSAVGRVKAAQILLALPPNSTEAAKKRVKQVADSLHRRLLAGDDFGRLATVYSNDVVSAASEGRMMEFGVGDYDPVFEKAVLNLRKNGAFSRPLLTAHGYHIVKRLQLLPVATKLNKETRELLQKRIEQNDRIGYLKSALAKKVVQQAGFQKLSFSDAELQAYTDSVLSQQPPRIRLTVQPSTALLKIGDHKATVAEWTDFAQTARYKRDGSGAKPYAQLWNEFVESAALNYYQDHLEEYNEEFRSQITEFAEGNLFFEIMQRQVWTPAQTDSVALTTYFQQHKNNYTWKESADAILFYASDKAAAEEFYNTVRQHPANWKTLLESFSEKITADSNRFELADIPRDSKQRLSQGVLTNPVVNKDNLSVSFAYILQLYPKPEHRTFSEAKGLVINDYQLQLEQKWVEKLKQKYPVHINQAVWAEVVKKATAPLPTKGGPAEA